MKWLVLGGTGSFGRAFVKKYHKEHEITVFSRDELKQFEMRREFPDVRYEIGDIRDRARVGEVMKGQDYAFHAAAMKQVPSCEFFPFEAVKTNILGSEHVINTAKQYGVKLVCLSTDKAVYPINAMGVSKAMMEKLAIAGGAIITRYGNVMHSRGSVIPVWNNAAKNGEKLKVTNPSMTRFLLSLDDSIDLVMFAAENGNPGDIFVKKAPATDMLNLAHATAQLETDAYNIDIVGVRRGEKLHETLIASEEMVRTDDLGDFFRINPESTDMDYGRYFDNGDNSELPEAYTSENAKQLSILKTKEIISGLKRTKN